MRCQTEITLLTFFVGFVVWVFFSGRVGVGWNFPDNMEGSMLLFPLDSIEWKLKWRQFLTLKVLAYSVTVPKAKEPITANIFKWGVVLNVCPSVKLGLNWPIDGATLWSCMVPGKIFFRQGFSENLRFPTFYCKRCGCDLSTIALKMSNLSKLLRLPFSQ